jgi:hypothetical protein
MEKAMVKIKQVDNIHLKAHSVMNRTAKSKLYYFKASDRDSH